MSSEIRAVPKKPFDNRWKHFFLRNISVPGASEVYTIMRHTIYIHILHTLLWQRAALIMQCCCNDYPYPAVESAGVTYMDNAGQK